MQTFIFLRFLLRFPLPLPTHTESTNPDVHKNTCLGIPHVLCHASARGDALLQMHRNSYVPTVGCKAMYKQCAFISVRGKRNGLNTLQRHWRSRNSACTKKCIFWLSASGVHILSPCLFSNIMFLLILAHHWTKEWDLEARKELYTNKKTALHILLSYLWNL